jgi:hypothetical protein
MEVKNCNNIKYTYILPGISNKYEQISHLFKI